jgi:hypothetical protein
MSNYWEKQRDLKRPYRKKALQSGMSQIRVSADSNPPPTHSYDTDTHKKTQPVRPGLDPHTYGTEIRSAIENLEFAMVLDQARYPWHLSPKGDSANVIQRSSSTLTLGNNEYVDILVLNVDGTTNSQTPTDPISGMNPPSLPLDTILSAGDSSTTNDFPGAAGSSATGITGTVQRTQTNQIFKISSFGHTEATYHTSDASGNPITYEIWVDGKLFMSWQNYQWAPVSPQAEQWQFKQPITVTQQIVFRIVNQSANGLDLTDVITACFSGWSETLDGYQDITHQQLEQT